MWTVFKSEMKKNFTPIKAISLVFMFVALTLFVVLIEKMYMFSTYDYKTIINDLLIYNLDFALIKLIIPTMLVSYTALSFAGDYGSGVMKYSLICGINRSELLLGKLLYLISLKIILSLICFFTLLSTGIFLFKDSVLIIDYNFYSIVFSYIITSLGMIVVILLTIFIFIFFSDYGINLTAGIVVLYLFLSIDRVLGRVVYFSPTALISYSHLAITSIEKTKNIMCFSLPYIFCFTIINLNFI